MVARTITGRKRVGLHYITIPRSARCRQSTYGDEHPDSVLTNRFRDELGLTVGANANANATATGP
jgi:hypothetical protein